MKETWAIQGPWEDYQGRPAMTMRGPAGTAVAMIDQRGRRYALYLCGEDKDPAKVRDYRTLRAAKSAGRRRLYTLVNKTVKACQ